jgi:diacylglycerol kinase family enzyme
MRDGSGMIPAFVNPLAGNAAAARDALSAVGGFDIREVPPHTLADHVRAAIGEGARRILVAGGDGTIGSAASALTGTGVELAILPCGTLNHLAKDLELPLPLEDAARVALNGRPVPVDSAVVNDRLFLNTSSVGAYVTFVRSRERLERRLGYHLASLVAGIQLLIRMPSFRITVHLEGERKQYLTPLVFIGVGERELQLPTLGARVKGGRTGLHVMIVRERSGGRAMALGLAAAARGTRAVAHTPAMDAFLVDELRIEARTRHAAVDGEIVPLGRTLEYRHVPGHLQVIVPHQKQAET